MSVGGYNLQWPGFGDSMIYRNIMIGIVCNINNVMVYQV